jgi:glyoxylase-like metal-dependent hydrolase (beta-lactamase superfamily II)/ferredoxin
MPRRLRPVRAGVNPNDMARLADRLPENAAGDVYVDAACIDCDTCRQVAPDTFAWSPRGRSYVAHQPRDAAGRQRALMALVACPTSAIGTVARADVRPAARAFPEPILPDIYYCGYASADSYGASSYLVRRPAGNVLVDSPRAARPLLDGIDALGGVALMFLSHRDDVADHDVFQRRYGCERVLHADDVTRATAAVERQPRGRDPVALADDLLMIPVPGHTAGSAALLYEDVLFTGDHLWGDDDRLDASRDVCWHSWRKQKESLARLLDFEFRAVLPGHGRRFLAASVAEMRAALRRLLDSLD